MTRTRVLLWLATLLITGACQSALEGGRRFETLEEPRVDPRFVALGILDVLPVGAGPLRWVIHPETRLRCAHARFPTQETGKVDRGLREYGFDLHRDEVPRPPRECGFGWGRPRGGVTYRNGEADDEVAAYGVVTQGSLFFWWDPPQTGPAPR